MNSQIRLFVSLFIATVVYVRSAHAQQVTIASVVPGSVCAGSFIAVTYTYALPDPGTVSLYLNGPNTTNVLLNQIAVSGGNGLITGVIPADRLSGSYTVFIRRVSTTNGTVNSQNSSTFTVIAKPAPPEVSTVTYILGSTSLPLTASGQNLKWYTGSSGGTASTVPPTPPTSASGTTAYYVSQTVNGCESNRATLTVTVVDYNVLLGLRAGEATNNGNYNTFIGSLAGLTNISGNNNTLLGGRANVKSGNLTNASAIGANALVSVSNALVLGDSVAGTKVGIGLTAPQFPLDVKGIINIRGNGTLKFSHLSNPALRQGTTDQFLTVNEQGETVLARFRLLISNASEWSDKVFSSNYLLRPLSEVDQYIRQHGHLPSVPSATEVAREGMDLVKMNTTLLEKVEELTLYSIQLEKANRQQDRELQELKQKFRQVEQLIHKVVKEE